MAATTAAGGALSHHHGIGLNRARYLPGYLGAAFDVLVAVKAALDPAGVLNPGKLGLPSPFGARPLAVSGRRVGFGLISWWTSGFLVTRTTPQVHKRAKNQNRARDSES